jgi:hypothetical protein
MSKGLDVTYTWLLRHERNKTKNVCCALTHSLSECADCSGVDWNHAFDWLNCGHVTSARGSLKKSQQISKLMWFTHQKVRNANVIVASRINTNKALKTMKLERKKEESYSPSLASRTVSCPIQNPSVGIQVSARGGSGIHRINDPAQKERASQP